MPLASAMSSMRTAWKPRTLKSSPACRAISARLLRGRDFRVGGDADEDSGAAASNRLFAPSPPTRPSYPPGAREHSDARRARRSAAPDDGGRDDRLRLALDELLDR